MDDLSDVNDIVRATVVATLRQMAEWGLVWDDGSQASDELLSLANQVDTMEAEDICCPMCQEIECDGNCPLLPARAQISSRSPGG